ncbi:MAG: rRNA pseudouridine synthase [Candidatus Zixiibacteriota bacterium]|nr:MAG: rRNA pseudouridine synthase [candidate division Zixibacteria bacterium]
MRLNRFLASCGLGSRRAVEEYITTGRIKVNGGVVSELATVVDPERDKVAFDDRPLSSGDRGLYILLNKPSGYLTTARDDFGRPTVMDLVKDLSQRVFPVGRLDMNSTGLVLLTNDGELAYGLSHPRYEIKKTYLVKVEGRPQEADLARLKEGIELDEGKTSPAQIEVKSEDGGYTLFQVEIHEGKKRQIRKMFTAIGHQVLELERIKLGKLQLGALKRGEWRELTEAEISELKKLIKRRK